MARELKGFVKVPIPSTDEMVHRAIKEGVVEKLPSDPAGIQGVCGISPANVFEARSGAVRNNRRKSLDQVERSSQD
jgi:hypothetical protein